MIKVLFVCLGNICRSPMAEAVFLDEVNKAGLTNKILADSAGTGPWHLGEAPHRGTLAVLNKNGISYNGRARQFRQSDLDEFDYVLAMDSSNLSTIRARRKSGKSETQLFLHYAKMAGMVGVDAVPDPYYDGRFDDVYDLVRSGCVALLTHIRGAHGI